MLHAPVLQLDAARVHEINPRNVESLFGMWTVFSRCSSTIPDGKRLENLSWRVWARETLCCPPQPEHTIVPSIKTSHPRPSEVPSLSNSVTSDSSATDSFSDSDKDTDSDESALSRSRGKETHLTPHTLEKIVVTIQAKSDPGEPLSPSIKAVVNSKKQPERPIDERSSTLSNQPEHRPSHYSAESSCISATTVATLSTERQSEHRNSDTSVSSDGIIRSGSVVHGFSPVPSSLRSRSTLSHALPSLASKNAAKNGLPAKPFFLGVSSDEDDCPLDHHMALRRSLAEPRKSSLSQTLSKDGHSQKKATSFRDIVEQRRVQEGSENDEGAIASSDEEDDDIDDSAIEDDDEEAWEDSDGDDEKPLTNKVFQRIDSRPNLVTRRSVLTQGLTESERAKGLLNAASKSTTAIRHTSRATSLNGPSMPVAPDDNEEDGAMTMRGMQGSKPMPIIATTSNSYAMAHSPRTTRRNMLSTELTESLRKNLLWERQQKNTTVNAFLKREAKSMANLQKAASIAPAHVNPLNPKPAKASKQNNSFNDYFNVASEYHTKGW